MARPCVHSKYAPRLGDTTVTVSGYQDSQHHQEQLYQNHNLLVVKSFVAPVNSLSSTEPLRAGSSFYPWLATNPDLPFRPIHASNSHLRVAAPPLFHPTSPPLQCLGIYNLLLWALSTAVCGTLSPYHTKFPNSPSRPPFWFVSVFG